MLSDREFNKWCDRLKLLEQAYIIASKNNSQPVNSSLETVDIKIGSSFLLDGKCLTVDHMGDSQIFLSGQEGLIQLMPIVAVF